MDLLKWFKQTVREKVLGLLDRLAGLFKDSNGKPDWRKAVQVFTQFCDNSLDLQPRDKQVIDDAIKALKLQDEVDALRSFWSKVPQPLRDTTKSLDNVAQPIMLNVLGQGGKGVSYGDLKGPLNSLINFSANADLSLAIQALDSNAAQQAVGLTAKADQRFLKMEMLGTLQAKGSGTLNMGFINTSGGAGARGSAALDYYYRDEGKWLFAEALVHNLPHLASPFDGGGIAAQSAHRLGAIYMSVEGSVDTSLDISAGKTWGASFDVKSDSLGLNTEVQVGASMNVGFQAGFNLMGSWNVLVKPIDTKILSVKVQKDSSKQTSTAFSLDASVGASGLDVVGNALIAKYLPDPSGLLAKLNEFSNLGSMLKQQIQKKLNQLLDADADDTLKKELIEVVTGDGSADTLATAIGSAAETALNAKLDVLEGKVSDAGKKIIEDVAAKLKLPGDLGNKLVQKAGSKMAGFLGDIESKIQNKLADIIGKGQGELKKLFKPLESVGETVSGLTGDINEMAQKLLNPVIKLLTRYQTLRNKISAAVQASSNLKVALHFARELKSASSSSAILEFEVDTSNAGAGEYFKEMMAGNYGNALTAARKGVNGSNGVKLTGGSFKASASRKLTTDVTLNLFGAKFTAKTILDSNVQAQVDVSGNVMMASSSATIEKTFSALGESRMVRFINLMEIPGSGSQNGQMKLFTSGLTMSYKDKKLKKSELNAYLGSLKKANLISESSLDAANKRYNELVDQADGKPLGGEIGLNMPLSSPDIALLIKAKDNDIQDIAINNQLENYLRDPKKRAAFDFVLSKWYDRKGDEVAQIKKIAAAGKLGDALSRYEIDNTDDRRDMNTVAITDRHYIHIAHRMGKNAVNLVKVVRNIRKASKVTFSPETIKKDVKKLNNYNKKMNDALNKWLKIRGILASLGIEKETVPAVTLAFIATIGELCQLGQGGTGFLTPTVKWSALGWQEEIYA